MVASISSRRSVSTRLAPNSASSLRTSRASEAGSASCRGAGTARTTTVVGERLAISKPSRVEGLPAFRGAGGVQRTDLQRGGNQQLLSGHAAALQRGLELLVHDALVRGVHVHDHQAGGVLREHIDPSQLREGEAERRGLFAARRERFGSARTRPEQRVVEAGRLAHRQADRLLARPTPGQAASDGGGVPRSAPMGPIPPVRGTGASTRQQPAQRMEHELVHGLRVAKPHLALGGVDVDVHPRGIDVQEQHVGRMAFVVQHILEGLPHGVGEQAVAHVAAVHEKVLIVAGPAAGSRRCNEAPDAHAGAGLVQMEQHRRQLVPEQSTDPRQRRLGPHAQEGAAVVLEAEGKVGPRQRRTVQDLVAMSELGGLGAQELAARRRVVVEVAHLDTGAGGAGSRLDWRELTTASLDPPGVTRVRGAARESQVRDGGDAGERLATEPEARHALQVLQGGDLAGGMARQGQGQLVVGDAAAVVGDLEQLGAARGQLHLDRPRARVHAVLQQLLEGSGGPLHHLPSGDLVDEQIGERANGGHAGTRALYPPGSRFNRAGRAAARRL